jgi:hypothetical protein
MLLSVTLCGCAAAPVQQEAPPEPYDKVPITLLQNLLPGTYSNYAQIHAAGSESPVTDIRIRQVKAAGEAVFLFESEQRRSADAKYDIYWLKPNPQTMQAEFHFTRLGADELSLPTQEVIRLAWQRVQPGCAVTMRRVENRIVGQSNAETCVFEDPLQGKTSLIRHLDFGIGNDTLIIQNRIESAAGQESGDKESLELLRHRVFTGWASVRLEAGTAEGEPGQWQLSTVFDIRDDGRIHHLRSQDRTSLGFGLQLSRLHRVEGEPPYFLLAVINLESGAPQAFNWFEPSSTSLDMNLDWMQANLQSKQTGED